MTKDLEEAVRLYRLAAAQGYADAQCNLGDMHRRGEGGPVDHAEARRLYRLAAAQGLADAQHELDRICAAQAAEAAEAARAGAARRMAEPSTATKAS